MPQIQPIFLFLNFIFKLIPYQKRKKEQPLKHMPFVKEGKRIRC
jgi:hypothetical protein